MFLNGECSRRKTKIEKKKKKRKEFVKDVKIAEIVSENRCTKGIPH